MKPVANIITMGCSKNLVDSERLMHMFSEIGYDTIHNPEIIDSGIVIVNTCGFIGDAKQESIEMILDCCRIKNEGIVSKVFVMGCLSERYAKELPNDIPEVDGWYGKFDWQKIISDLKKEAHVSWQRTLTTPPHYAYLKIAEGCNRFCAFCAIPLITGRYQSRTIEEIKAEVIDLVSKGVKEFNVLAQDLTYYGKDIYGKSAIALLIDELAQLPGVRWIRLHYAYPTDFPYDLLPIMAKHDNVCKYLDIALQHISDSVLQRMQRHITGEETRQLIDRIRREVPGITLRTTLMVGFPGETDNDFDELMKFVEDTKFERMGAFKYCEEEGTAAARLYKDNVPEEIKNERLDALMALQEKISLKQNEDKVGKKVSVIIDTIDESEKCYRCRTQYDSPEVDQEVLIYFDQIPSNTVLNVGDYCDVTITEAYPFDLVGII